MSRRYSRSFWHVDHKSRRTELRWRRPASTTSLVGAAVAGLVFWLALLTAIIARHPGFFFVAIPAFLVFFGFTSYGVAANRRRERAELSEQRDG